MTELSSSFSEQVVRIQARAYARMWNSAGGECSVTLIWSAENPHAMIFMPLFRGQTETWVFAVDLLDRGSKSDEPIGEGNVVVCTTAISMVRIKMIAPNGSWMRVNMMLRDVVNFLTAVSARMLNLEEPQHDLDAELAAMLDTGGASGTWEDPS